MGLWGKVKKAAKKVGKQVKRSVAVAAPILLGPGLGEKVGVSIAKTAGSTAKKSMYQHMGQTSKVTGKVVQVAGTAVASWFGGPVAGAAVYKFTGTMGKLGQNIVKTQQYKEGLTHTKPTRMNWSGEAMGLGTAVVGALAGSQVAGVDPLSGLQGVIGESLGGRGDGGAAGSSGGGGASGFGGVVGVEGLNPAMTPVLVIAGLLLIWYFWR
jgi:hypothetical protein